MLTLTVLVVLAFVVAPALAWVFGLVMRLLGWTLRMTFSVLLLPVWIILALVGCLAGAASLIVPIALVVCLVSFITQED